MAVVGDPLADIAEMEHMKFVMKGGVVFRNDLKQIQPLKESLRH